MHPHSCPGSCAPSGTNLDGCEAIHAEQNALLQCAEVQDVVTCTKLLLNTGCRRIAFSQPYAHDEAARTLWVKAGRLWLHQPPRA